MKIALVFLAVAVSYATARRPRPCDGKENIDSCSCGDESSTDLLILGIAKRLTLSLFLVHVLMVQNGKHQKGGQKYVMGTLTLAYAVIMQLLK